MDRVESRKQSHKSSRCSTRSIVGLRYGNRLRTFEAFSARRVLYRSVELSRRRPCRISNATGAGSVSRIVRRPARMMKHQDDFTIGGMVSVWVGNFQTADQLDDYMNLSRDFEEDFGFRLNERAVQEATVEDSAKPVGELVNGFSSWESFAPRLIETATATGIESATTMIVFYCLRFSPAEAKTNPNAPLRFIGAFTFWET